MWGVNLYPPYVFLMYTLCFNSHSQWSCVFLEQRFLSLLEGGKKSCCRLLFFMHRRVKAAPLPFSSAPGQSWKWHKGCIFRRDYENVIPFSLSTPFSDKIGSQIIKGAHTSSHTFEVTQCNPVFCLHGSLFRGTPISPVCDNTTYKSITKNRSLTHTRHSLCPFHTHKASMFQSIHDLHMDYLCCTAPAGVCHMNDLSIFFLRGYVTLTLTRHSFSF